MSHMTHQCVAVCCSVLQCVAVCCSVLQDCLTKKFARLKWRVAVCCSVLHCVAACCSVMRRVAVCCSVLQCVAVCCSVLQLNREVCASKVSSFVLVGVWFGVLRVCCSVLQSVADLPDKEVFALLCFVAVCCSALQCVAACCKVSEKFARLKCRVQHCNTPQHTATYCNNTQECNLSEKFARLKCRVFGAEL